MEEMDEMGVVGFIFLVFLAIVIVALSARFCMRPRVCPIYVDLPRKWRFDPRRERWRRQQEQRRHCTKCGSESCDGQCGTLSMTTDHENRRVSGNRRNIHSQEDTRPLSPATIHTDLQVDKDNKDSAVRESDHGHKMLGKTKPQLKSKKDILRVHPRYRFSEAALPEEEESSLPLLRRSVDPMPNRRSGIHVLRSTKRPRNLGNVHGILLTDHLPLRHR